MSDVRHKCFISYHHDDQAEVDEFVNTFDEERDVFITRGLGIEIAPEIVNSDDADYVMRRVKELYLKDSTVTIVLVGTCTWARRFVDWELQSSLRHGETATPNGVLGIVLASVGKNPIAPERLRVNLNSDTKDGYARWYWYPTRTDALAGWIDDAYEARTTRAHLIINSRDRFKNNRTCP